MLLISRLRSRLTVVAPIYPIAVHFLMIVAVTFYTVLGAYCIRALENAHINKINRQNGFEVGDRREQIERSKRDNDELILTGAELAAVAPELRPCVQKAIRDLLVLSSCHPDELKTLSITTIDSCYRNAEIDVNKTRRLSHENVYQEGSGGQEEKEKAEWDFHNSLVFCFTVITTIGYGNVVPVSFEGRLFCLVYGLFGIPLTVLTLANIGMFLHKGIKKLSQICSVANRRVQEWWSERESAKSQLGEDHIVELNGSLLNTRRSEENKLKSSETDEISLQPKRATSESVLMAIVFALYLIIGSLGISSYEPEMTFFVALYYNFVSLTTIGLGDVLPQNRNYIFLTFCYLSVGLALTTVAIEIASEMLKKIHYFGRKVNAEEAEVWFGGKKMKLKNLVGHLSDQLNIPIEQLKSFNLNSFVEDAMKVADGELQTLRRRGKQSKVETPKLEKTDEKIQPEEFISYTSEESPLQTARNANLLDAKKKSGSAR